MVKSSQPTTGAPGLLSGVETALNVGAAAFMGVALTAATSDQSQSNNDPSVLVVPGLDVGSTSTTRAQPSKGAGRTPVHFASASQVHTLPPAIASDQKAQKPYHSILARTAFAETTSVPAQVAPQQQLSLAAKNKPGMSMSHNFPNPVPGLSSGMV